MKDSLNVVVTCTDKKSLPAEPGLSVRSLPNAEPSQRVAQWISRLSSAVGPTVSLRDLYLGNHWSIIRSISNSATPLRVKVWVASAGYGLLPIDTPVHSYSATFSDGNDSVGDSIAGRIWWEALSNWHVANVQQRRIRDLAVAFPQTPLIIVGSANYISALFPDIVAASQALTTHTFGVISAGYRRDGELQAFMLPADARFKQRLSGPMHSLNASILDYAIRISAQWYPDLAKLRQIFKAELESLPALARIERGRQTDDDVVAFIRGEVASNPTIARGTLLRRFRSSGRACEQSRFKELYLQTVAAQDA